MTHFRSPTGFLIAVITSRCIRSRSLSASEGGGRSGRAEGEDGVVAIDYEKCIGCRYCLAACPYSARTFDAGEYYTDDTPARQPYEEQVSPEYDEGLRRSDGGSPIGNARKCHFCLHRLEAGMLPACVTSCIGHATYFGDANDPDSLVAELVGRPEARRLKEELGTRHRVYYLT